jgi:hypothetical protein
MGEPQRQIHGTDESPVDHSADGCNDSRIRAGVRDAYQNRPAFLWAVLWNPPHRHELLQQGWKDVGRVFLIATILDVVYQLIVLRGGYILELLITAVTLAIVPYVLLRGPVSRIVRVVLAAKTFSETTLDPISSVTLA